MPQVISNGPPTIRSTDPEPVAPIASGFAVVGLAAYVGVLVTIGLGLGRYWSTLPPEAYASQFDEIFEFLVPAIAITLLPAIIGVALALRRSWRTTHRTLWLTAAIALAVSLAITVLYHVPANTRIWSDTITPDQIDTELQRWLLWHALRTLAGLAATLAAFRATLGGTNHAD